MSEFRIQQKIIIAGTKPTQAVDPKEDLKPELQPKPPVANPKSADEVLDYLSNSSAIAASKGNKAKTKKIEVSKYVTPEQAAGIGESVNRFFAGMEAHVEKAVKEFNLTSIQAQDLISTLFNQQFNDEDTAIIASGEHLILT
jgi:hypothetical protein